MRFGNKATRDKAIPFISIPIGVSSSLGYGALTTPQGISDSNNARVAAVPMTRPDAGDVIEAYLFMEMKAPSTKALQVRLGIGSFTTVGGSLSPTPSVNPTPSQITEMHKIITGSEAPFEVAANGTLTIDADLTKLIPRNGDSNFSSDFICLLVQFVNGPPSTANGYRLNKFKMSCTAQMGLAT